MTIQTDVDTSRFELAVRKFLAFERACGRAQSLSRYCELLRNAFMNSAVDSQDTQDRVLLNRLVQVGLLKFERHLSDAENTIRHISTIYLPLQIPEPSGRQTNANRWLFNEFGSHEILRFYAMRSAGIGWIMRDLERQVHEGRQTESRAAQNRVAANTLLLGQIWRICLHYELTEVESGELRGAEFDADPIDEISVATNSAVFKEKLGLAQMPNVHQLRHIKATCHYHRKSTGWDR